MSNVKEISDQNFKAEVLDAQLPVLVDFWAPWCAPCRMLSPVIEALGEKLSAKLKTVKLNIDENQQTAAQFGITAIPTLIIFKSGQEVDRLVGAPPSSILEEKISRHVG